MTLNQALKLCKELNTGLTGGHPFAIFEAGGEHYVKHFPSDVAVKDKKEANVLWVLRTSKKVEKKAIKAAEKKAQPKLKPLSEASFKKIDTVGDLMKFLKLCDPKEKITMFSDEEGNQVNKILCLELYVEGLTLIPWEQY